MQRSENKCEAQDRGDYLQLQRSEKVCFILFLGETVITDHVRSIVRECLQEADVKWISSHEPDINGNYGKTGFKDVEQPLDEYDDQVY